MKYQIINISGGRLRLVFFIIMVLFGFVIAFFSAIAITKIAGYNKVMEQISNPNLKDINTLNVFSIFQIFFQMGLFLIGPGLYLLLVEQNPIQKLGLNRSPLKIDYLLIVLLMVVCLPGINLSYTLNQAMHLPHWFAGIEKWMQEKENSANDITDAYLSMKSYKDLGFNLIMFGFMPAVGEELFFRGALFAIIKDWTHRKHLTIFITAFLFSAIHLQFYGFLPRFLLGIGLGYLFIFTRSLWAPILAHFLNNLIVVCAAFFFFQGKSAISQDDFGSVDNLGVNLMSIAITIFILWLIYKRNLTTDLPVDAGNIEIEK